MAETHWLEIDPIDTLFLGGTESMAAGENHQVDSLFPPMPPTLTGAVRTALLLQKGINPGSWSRSPEQFPEAPPLLGTPDKPGFTVIGPLFRAGTTTLYPAPAHWMANPGLMAEGTPLTVQAGKPLHDALPGLIGSVEHPFWVNRPASGELRSLAGYWISEPAFQAMHTGQGDLVLRTRADELKMDEPALLPLAALFCREERTGIGMTRHRTVREGHLYVSVHIRLRNTVKLLTGIHSEHEMDLDDQGILQLGGEQRVCAYRRTAPLTLPGNEEGDLLYTLSPVPLRPDSTQGAGLPEDLVRQPRVSGPLIRTGGWNMKKRFHKPLAAWFPAGTVIAASRTVSAPPQCISL